MANLVWVAVLLPAIAISGSAYHLARVQGRGGSPPVNRYGATVLVAIAVPHFAALLYLALATMHTAIPTAQLPEANKPVDIMALPLSAYLACALFTVFCFIIAASIGHVFRSKADAEQTLGDHNRRGNWGNIIHQNCYEHGVCHLSDGSVVAGLIVNFSEGSTDMLSGDIAMVRAEWIRHPDHGTRLLYAEYPDEVTNFWETLQDENIGGDRVTVLRGGTVDSVECYSLIIFGPYLHDPEVAPTDGIRGWWHRFFIRKMFVGPTTIGG